MKFLVKPTGSLILSLKHDAEGKNTRKFRINITQVDLIYRLVKLFPIRFFSASSRVPSFFSLALLQPDRKDSSNMARQQPHNKLLQATAGQQAQAMRTIMLELLKLFRQTR